MYEESRLRGAGPVAKRGRVVLRDMTEKADDIPEVKAVFSIMEFGGEKWLETLSYDQITTYRKMLETNRSSDRQVQGTVEFIKEFATLKD